MNTVWQATPADNPRPFGLPVLADPVPLSRGSFELASRGIAQLWQRILAQDPRADERPLLLSYDMHPTAGGLTLIEVNTNAGGVLTAIEATHRGNGCCADHEKRLLQARLLALFRRDLLGGEPIGAGVVAIVDDELASQPLLAEMRALAAAIRPLVRDAIVVDAAELVYRDGRLWHGGQVIDCIYWRSTDFMLQSPAHAQIAQAVEAGSVRLAPAPAAYRAIADKRRLIDWSDDPVLARDQETGMELRVARTLPMAAGTSAQWYARRADWVFKPIAGHGSRGVYVGKRISRPRLESLPRESFLSQQYVPHPVIERDGVRWKYDLRFFADRGSIIGVTARIFQGQVVGMHTPGSGFAPVRVTDSCCLLDALRLQ